MKGGIVTYHCTHETIPEAVDLRLHNVPPDTFYAQVCWLKRHFDIVSIDEWFSKTDTTGQVAITFDDGYTSVFEEALPRLIDLKVPSTVFLCKSLLEGRVFWRTKVRFIIERGLSQGFAEFFGRLNRVVLDGLRRDLFEATKDATINSAEVDEAMDLFLLERGLSEELRGLHDLNCSAEQLINHPLVTYGNHTCNHYVLSSLSPAQQEEEIAGMEAVLDRLDLPRSRVFCLPFGGMNHANSATFDVCRKLGLTGFVYLRDRSDLAVPLPPQLGMTVSDRLGMPPRYATFIYRHGLPYALARWLRRPA